MQHAAHVTDVADLSDFRAAWCVFGDNARDALDSAEAEIRRTFAWLDDQLKYWQAMVRKCEDEVFQAKQELRRRKIIKFNDRPPDTTEQEKALKKAQARLEHAEEKVEKTQHWLRQLPTAVMDYEGPARQLKNFLEADLPRASALLEQKLASLEAYLALQAESRRPASVASTGPADKPAEGGERKQP